MAFRFIHTADLHLDSPLNTLALRNADLAGDVRIASRTALERIVSACIENEVDALILAGDLYDGDQRSIRTAEFLTRQMRRLHEKHIRVFIIRGNHDAASAITRELSLPDNVHVFDTSGGTVRIEHSGVAVHGVSFPKGRVPKSLLPRFAAPVPGMFNIGLLHTSVSGSEGHDVYAPCTLAELKAQGYDYWALGHIHKRMVHSRDPAIVMPGIPQGRDINEDGRKSATLVTIDGRRLVDIAEVPTASVQFERVRVNLTGADELPEILRRAETALEQTRSGVAADLLAARPHLLGQTTMAPWLRLNDTLMLSEFSLAAERIGGTRIDRVVLDCKLPSDPGNARGGPLGDLRQILSDGVRHGAGPTSEARARVDALRKALPPEIRNTFGASEADMDALITRMTSEGAEAVLAHLISSEPD
jgi:exonuclease SbcD